MNPLIGSALITGAAGIGGGLLSSSSSARAAAKAQEAQIQWEMFRAQNAHQWEVQDLKAAGLNPILSAGGNGATTGGISAPVPDTTGYQAAGQAVGQAVASALDVKRVQNETEQKEIAILKGRVEADNIIADTLNKYNQNGLITAQTAESMEKAGLISKQQATEISKQALNYAQVYKTDAERQKTQTETNQMIIKFSSELEILQNQIETAKANKDWSKANALIKEYESKHRKFAFWMDQVGKGMGAAKQGASAAAIMGAI